MQDDGAWEGHPTGDMDVDMCLCGNIWIRGLWESLFLDVWRQRCIADTHVPEIISGHLVAPGDQCLMCSTLEASRQQKQQHLNDWT